MATIRSCLKSLNLGEVIGYSNGGDVYAYQTILGLDQSGLCTSGLYIDLHTTPFPDPPPTSGGTGTSGGTVTLQVDSASDPERVADMASLFYAFVAVLVVVWGVKQLLNLFTGDTEK